MAVYVVYCPEPVNAQFGGLKSVTVRALNEKSAILEVKKWLADTGKSFKGPENTWQVSMLKRRKLSIKFKS